MTFFSHALQRWCMFRGKTELAEYAKFPSNRCLAFAVGLGVLVWVTETRADWRAGAATAKINASQADGPVDHEFQCDYSLANRDLRRKNGSISPLDWAIRVFSEYSFNDRQAAQPMQIDAHSGLTRTEFACFREFESCIHNDPPYLNRWFERNWKPSC